MKAAAGMVVSMHYTLTDDSGAVIDSSLGGEPLAYLHGHGNIIPGLEKALEGVTVGHKAKVTVAPAEGYGEHDPSAVFDAPREHFPPDLELKPGVRVTADGPQGPISLVIVAVNDTSCTLDANHPLAGKTLFFDVEIMKIRPATQEEIAHGHTHEGHHHHG
jgi:FKBP-type peptidyl-prolyl cis-trans isomerase SlyD